MSYIIHDSTPGNVEYHSQEAMNKKMAQLHCVEWPYFNGTRIASKL